MPSALERIHAAHNSRAIKDQRDQVLASQRLEKERIASERAQQKTKKKKESEKRSRREIVDHILEETGIIDELTNIEKSECSNFRKHAVIVTYDAYPIEFTDKTEPNIAIGEHNDWATTVTLAWGEYFDIEDGHIVEERSFGTKSWEKGKLIYDYVRVAVEPNSKIIRVGKKVISPQMRKKDPEALLDAIAESYLDPSQVRPDSSVTPDFDRSGR